MADRNPFEMVFNPDNTGTATGLAGRIFGVPTQAERIGEIQSRAMSEYSRIVQGGNLTPQQGVLELMKTPVGQELFRSGTDAIKSFGELVNTVQPPAPTVMSPGSQAIDRTGKVVASAPTQEVQNIKGLQQLAQLSPERLKEVAQINMLPAEDRKLFALKQGGLDPLLAAKLVSGVIEVKESKDLFGKPSGNFVIIDKSTNSIIPLNVGKTGSSNTASAVAPSATNPEGIADPSKLNMFLGTGVWPTGLRYLDNMVRSTFAEKFGTATGQTAQQRHRDLKDLEVAVTSFPEIVGRTNKVLDTIRSLLPKAINPASDSVDAGINIYQIADRELKNIETTLTSNDPYVSDQAKSDMSKQRLGYLRILRSLPPLQDMVKLKEAIIKDGGGSFSASSGVQAFKELGGNVLNAAQESYQNLTSGKKPAAPAAPQAAAPAAPAQAQAVTPEQVPTMSIQQLSALNPATLSPAVKSAVQNRIRQLLLQRRQPAVQ